MASQVEMPSSLFGDIGGGPGIVEDQSAFRLALELSMLSLGESMPVSSHLQPLGSPLGFAPPPDERTKKSQNMTECVPVPSSEHVAEIVGRQGMRLFLVAEQCVVFFELTCSLVAFMKKSRFSKSLATPLRKGARVACQTPAVRLCSIILDSCRARNHCCKI